ncbi:Pvc16 family protein [Streptomyces sp. NPDC048196]|uniref:Pvc16 family protein n=1 Tax=Streptomyces sp. NPDC048196 TaxID=3154712 RepID=UPI00340913A3
MLAAFRQSAAQLFQGVAVGSAGSAPVRSSPSRPASPAAGRSGRNPAGTPAIQFPALSLLLYRVDFDKSMRASWSARGAADGRSCLPLDLHYLLTAWADDPEHEHLTVGRTRQVLQNVAVLSGPLLDPSGDWESDEGVQLILEDLSAPG